MDKKAFAEDYEIVTTQDEKGREKQTAVYRGVYFEVDLDERGILRFRRLSLLYLAVFIVAHVSGGFVQNRGMFQWYISLPYVLAFFPFVYAAAGVLHLPKEKRNYRRDEIGLSFGRLKSNSRILLIFLGIGILGEVIFLMFFSAGGQCTAEFIYLALDVLAAALVFSLTRLQRQVHVQACEAPATGLLSSE
jgi:hypothetical protein